MKKILVLEDDVMIASGLTYALSMEGYEPIHAATLKKAFSEIEKGSFDLAILDLQLPDGTGFEVSHRLQEKSVPVIFLTVVDDEANIVRAFDEGADDYVVKPFKVRELLARVKRTLERNDGSNTEMIHLGKLKIDTKSGKVYIGEQLVELTALEYRLLLIFATNRGILLTRAQILERIWDVDGSFVEDNTLTVYIKRLREKVGDALEIETVRGIGYRVG
ncbi:MAG: response regulator transcription factor [Acetatifactor sp.]|nr:response regulator transcription factor [Acetatifactor sp.]